MEIGVLGHKEWVVTEAMLAKNVGSGTVAVFATPMMVAGIEGTAEESVRSLIGDDKVTVGTALNVTHIAATPLGMKVRFETELTEINGKILTFKVEAYDEREKIGEGTHMRAIVSKERFESKAQSK